MKEFPQMPIKDQFIMIGKLLAVWILCALIDAL